MTIPGRRNGSGKGIVWEQKESQLDLAKESKPEERMVGENRAAETHRDFPNQGKKKVVFYLSMIRRHRRLLSTKSDLCFKGLC